MDGDVKNEICDWPGPYENLYDKNVKEKSQSCGNIHVLYKKQGI